MTFVSLEAAVSAVMTARQFARTPPVAVFCTKAQADWWKSSLLMEHARDPEVVGSYSTICGVRIHEHEGPILIAFELKTDPDL